MSKRLKHVPSSEGFELQRFENSELISKDLLCMICMCIPRDPQIHGSQGCDHLFCASCLSTWLAEHDSCPSCRQPVTSTCPAYRIVQSMLNDLRISCEYAKQGCTVTVRLEELKAHLKECPKAPVRCPDCSQVMTRDLLPAHRPACEEREVDCEQCQAKVKFSQLKVHVDSVCPKARMQCACGRLIRRADLVKHQCSDCPEMEVTCPIPHCGLKLARRMVSRHLEEAAIHHISLLGAQVAHLTSVLLHSASDEQKEMLQQWRGNPTAGPNAFVWSVDFSKEMVAELQLVASGEDRRVDPVHSPPCYTSQGYCFELLLYPNGNSRENGGHFALFWGLIPGANDCNLTWPCIFQQVELRVGTHRYTVQVSSESRSRPSQGKKGHHRGIGKMCPVSELSVVAQDGVVEVFVRIT